ncbi:MAG: hypothetical protein AB7N80_13485 [Bdellovibrionales bacterium]
MSKTLIFVFGLLCATASADPCLKRRGALDIGSGATKAFAAVVDVCKKKIVETLFDQKIPIAFGDTREHDPKNEIPLSFAQAAGKKISNLVKEMKEKRLERIDAVATAAFRAAANGPAAAAEIAKQSQITVKILSQQEEAEIGAQSALAQLPPKKTAAAKPVIVWDIGGGSMQMWSKGKDQNQVFMGDLAAVTFKNRIIRELKNQNPAQVYSPNPLGAQSAGAVALAADHAKSNVPEYFKKKAGSARWVGLGGVLALSVQKQVAKDKKEFSETAVKKALEQRAALQDSEIESEYRATEISNLALVLGYMRALKIKTVETVEASLVQGWLLHQP